MNFISNLCKKLFKNSNEEHKYEKTFNKSTANIKKVLPDFMINDSLYDDNYFEKLEELLILSDIGFKNAKDITNEVKKIIDRTNNRDADHINELIFNHIKMKYLSFLSNKEAGTNIINSDNVPNVFLFIGVNGVGKTSTIAKLAKKLKDKNNKVLIVAGDTFRAGATEQLKIWAVRIGVDITYTQTGESSGVIYDGIKKAIQEKYDYVLCDTAGRLQNKINLMNELKKIEKVIKKLIPDAPHETFLVLDACTGQNGVSQAQAFSNSLKVTGLIITKMDGTAKGGISFSIVEILKIPIKLITMGESLEDLDYFNIDKYIVGLFKEFYK